MMRIGEARSRAVDWVQAYAAGHEVRGAFFSGSSLEADPAADLSADSDVDVVLVVDGDPPAKLGKIIVDGLPLDVSFLARDEVSDPEAVARTFFLAPSFRHHMIIVDTDGGLGRVHDHVRRVFADPARVRARYQDVLARMDDRLAALDGVDSWTEQLHLWLFAGSLPTQVLLVAGLCNPTVRLRYLRVRELLAEAGLPEVYEGLLGQLGADAASARTVRDQLARLPVVFDAAARVNRGGLPFASDIGPAGREVALSGTERLVAAGHHREAVFWLAVTLLRSQLILDADAAPEVAAEHRPAVLDAIDVLIRLHNPADLAARRDALAGARPGLVAVAERLVSGSR